jgi:putative colanic acid biosysnthesis UDP-glucose lipid carrier transferase
MDAKSPLIIGSAEAGNGTLIRRTFKTPLPRERPIEFLESLVDALALIGTLWTLALYIEGGLSNPYWLLGFVVFSMTFPGPSYLRIGFGAIFRRVALGWLTTAGLLYLFGYAAHMLRHFDQVVLVHWLWLAPTVQLAIRAALNRIAPWLLGLQGDTRQVVIAGMNGQGLALAGRIASDSLSGMKVRGFFDDRSLERLPASAKMPLLGKLSDLPRYVRACSIDTIFLSLPMAAQPRILGLLDQLRDTTVSIYFVPDLFITDLIQGRMDAVDDIPVVAVCESPFTGLNGLIKRISDIAFSAIILALVLPLLSAIAIGVKATSPGPAIFRQRRYGLDGKEIIVYKFRSMTVCEDGPTLKQAQQNDQRVTPFGAFLRRTSLDELPQFINVIQGRMSIVGPRPHAVAHNELYRKLIKGYMIRHKVKPGITGWAQVHGYRGETDTMEKMQKRIDCDLEYLRNWSLRLDIFIIFKTPLALLRRQNAY